MTCAPIDPSRIPISNSPNNLLHAYTDGLYVRIKLDAGPGIKLSYDNNAQSWTIAATGTTGTSSAIIAGDGIAVMQSNTGTTISLAPIGSGITRRGIEVDKYGRVTAIGDDAGEAASVTLIGRSPIEVQQIDATTWSIGINNTSFMSMVGAAVEDYINANRDEIRGPQGAKGEKGDTGADGADGDDGADGRDGSVMTDIFIDGAIAGTDK